MDARADGLLILWLFSLHFLAGVLCSVTLLVELCIRVGTRLMALLGFGQLFEESFALSEVSELWLVGALMLVHWRLC